MNCIGAVGLLIKDGDRPVMLCTALLLSAPPLAAIVTVAVAKNLWGVGLAFPTA
jgi:ABC-type dipeptide/oligopeptide/nickel transport system permease subunit